MYTQSEKIKAASGRWKHAGAKLEVGSRRLQILHVREIGGCRCEVEGCMSVSDMGCGRLQIGGGKLEVGGEEGILAMWEVAVGGLMVGGRQRKVGGGSLEVGEASSLS